MSNMADSPVIHALKEALMVEIKGQQLYAHAVTQTTNPDAKKLFEMLAEDEVAHTQILKTQITSLMEDGTFDLSEINPAELDHGSQNVVSDEFKRSLKRGDFEMAVIGIGVDLETRAIDYYTKQAAETDSPELKKLFTWLSEWEVDHLNQLRELETLYQDAYWADQGFSPM